MSGGEELPEAWQQQWYPEIGLWTSEGAGHTAPVADADRVHPGTVAFHSITGMAALDELLELRDSGELRFTVWPFEPVDDSAHVLVESYPALHPPPADWGPCRDADEREVNRTGTIERWFAVPDVPFGRVDGVPLEEQVDFEAFIFGLR